MENKNYSQQIMFGILKIFERLCLYNNKNFNKIS